VISNIPQVKGLPILGSTLAANKDQLGFLKRVVRECGDIGLFQLGRKNFVLINSPELVQSFLLENAQDYDKGEVQHTTFRMILGNSLSLSEGEAHRVQRMLLAPIFYNRNMEKYAKRIVNCANCIIEKWKENTEFDFFEEMMRLTLNTFCNVLMDIELLTETEFDSARQTVWNWINYVAIHPIRFPLSIPTSRNQRFKSALNVLNQRVRAIITERRSKEEDRGDILSKLVLARYEDGRGMSDAQIYDETIAFLFAAHETGASAITWSFYLLNNYPEIYSKVRYEIDTVLDERLPTYADLRNLPYTLQVLKEAMRLYPPAARQFRVALKDTELGGYTIPKGTTVQISQYLLHRRSDCFPNPENFNPDRFTEQNEKNLPRFAYLPFGGGNRNCLGKHYAMIEGHLLLATLLQRVNFVLLPKQQNVMPELAVTLRPERPIKAIVKRRTHTIQQR